MTLRRSTPAGSRLRARLALAGLVAGWSNPTLALDADKRITQYAAKQWGPADGLTQKNVVSIVQTQDGYLWLATREGLLRFDGARFTSFDKTNSPGLLHSHLSTLLVDGEGALWVGTYGGGVSRMKDGVFTAFTTDHGLAGNLVRSIALSRSGGLWIGTDSGLSRFQNGRFVSYSTRDGLSNDDIRALHEDRSGALWIGTATGLDRLAGGRFVPYETVDGTGRRSIWPVAAIHEGRDGTLWFGTLGAGLNRLQDGVLTSFTRRDGLVDDSVISISSDRDSTLWVGTLGGLSRLKRSRFETYRSHDASEHAIRAIFEDHEGNIWIGTRGLRGLRRLSKGKFLPYGPPEGLPAERIWSIIERKDGSVWAGGGLGALARFEDGAVAPLPSLGSHAVRTLFEASDGSLWVGSEGGGLLRLHGGRIEAYTTRNGLPSDTVWALQEDAKGALWIGTDGGLARFAEGRFSVLTKDDGLPSPVVRTIHRGRDDRLWLGTNAGLVRMHGADSVVFGTREGLTSNLVRSIHEDDDGTVWVGTLGGGLNRLRNGRITAFTAKQGLPDDVVWTVIEDGHGRLWMSGNKGLTSVSRKTLDDYAEGRSAYVVFTAYGTADGLREGGSGGGSSPSACRTRDGRLWFPTSTGLVVVTPGPIARNEHVPPVRVEEVLVDGKLMSGSEPLLPARGDLEVHYTALSFVAPEKVRFKYQLEGFDAGWVDAETRRTAYYTKVPPGRYRFRVVAQNNDGIWNEAGAAVAIELLPRFHQTRWFLAVCLLSAAGVASSLHALRVRRLRASERELAQRVEEGMAQIKVLKGLLPICASCKSVRDDRGYWNRIESYIALHSEAEFSHGICPECLPRLYPKFAERRETVASGRG
jgi:ligand-binding sensor domain-containing protein